MTTKIVTDKYANMISAFQCDFSLVRDGYKKLSTLDYELNNTMNNERLLKDIELLEELEIGLRYGKLKIIEVEE